MQISPKITQKMKFYDNTKYAFLLAIVRAYESKMLTPGEVERMLGAKDAAEAYRVFNDMDYAKYMGDAEQIEDFQTVINAGLLEIKALLLENAPYPHLLDILWLRFDFSNLKALVKAQIQEKDFAEVEEMFLPYGKFSFADMSALFAEKETLFGERVKSKDELKLEELLQEAIQQAQESFAENNDPVLVDACVDRVFYSYLNDFLPTVKSNFVIHYYEQEVDLKNIRAYLRAVALEKTDLFPKLYLQGGTLQNEIYQGDFTEFTANLEKTPYADLVRKGIEAYNTTKSFLEFEKSSDALLLDHMTKARYINLGIEPIFAFFWIKENNAQIIRTIMVNKLNNIDPAEIRKKIRKLYK